MSSILIIDDDAVCRKSMALILQMEGFDIRATENGTAALAMIRENRPDLILCDIIMPGIDGHTFLESVKNDSSSANIPFIFVSALSDRTDVRTGMSKGADDYLTKPFTAEELLSAVISRLLRFEAIRQPLEDTHLQKKYAQLCKQITARELEVLLLVGKGLTSKEIAVHLDIRTSTVHVHRANLMRKLDVANAATLSYWAHIAEQMTSSTA